MKIEKTVKVNQCDICGTSKDVWRKCNNCGQDICYSCKEKHAKEYHAEVFIGGSHEGFYCNQCDQEARLAGTDIKHRNYLKIKELEEEHNKWYGDWKIRCKKAEEALGGKK